MYVRPNVWVNLDSYTKRVEDTWTWVYNNTPRRETFYFNYIFWSLDMVGGRVGTFQCILSQYLKSLKVLRFHTRGKQNGFSYCQLSLISASVNVASFKGI